jgi:hypothetical protein
MSGWTRPAAIEGRVAGLVWKEFYSPSSACQGQSAGTVCRKNFTLAAREIFFGVGRPDTPKVWKDVRHWVLGCGILPRILSTFQSL